jgi:hypothetical protein
MVEIFMALVRIYGRWTVEGKQEVAAANGRRIAKASYEVTVGLGKGIFTVA